MLRFALLCVMSLALAACDQAPNAPTRVVVEWKTGTELDTAGFNLYRGESQDGPFGKINATLIPASNDALVGGKYRYEDTNVAPGKTYYYQLEDVELSGTTTRHGPIVVTASGAWGVPDIALMLLAVGVIAGGAVYWAWRRDKS